MATGPVRHRPDIRTICLTLTSLASGGAEKQCLVLAGLLQDQYNVKMAIINAQPAYQKHLQTLKEQNISNIILQGNIFQKIRTLRRFFIENQVDLVLSYLPQDIAVAAIAGRGIVKYHVGGIRNAYISPIKVQILKYLHNHWLSGSVSNSAAGKNFLVSRGFDSHKIGVIPNGIKIETVPITRGPAGLVTITTMGRLVKQKDFETAIRSIDHVRSLSTASSPKIQLNIVGQGPDQSKLQSLIERLHLTDQIFLITDPADISPILRNSDIYLCTSIFEGISNAIMEAMAYSLPVVATDVGDNQILVKDQINGFIVPVNDPACIGHALKKLVDSPELRNRYGKQSYQILHTHYDLDIFKTSYLTYINSLNGR
jgi:glycosyltransferase involved in cell wall biosynthesis